MSASNKYDNMSALDALKYVKNRNMLLPDIQREYVWVIEDIEKLFESIVDDYPIGACIFWKTTRNTINKEKPNLYYFIRKFAKGITRNEKAPEFFNEESDYYIVLDGQQRITSLNIALYGSYTYYKGGRGKAASNSKNWTEKELYYNLGFHDETEHDDEHLHKRFCFLTKEEGAKGNYYKVKSMLAYDDSDDYFTALNNLTKEKKCRKDLWILFQRLRDSSSNGLIHYYCISENTYDEALDIFVRVNSTGKKLSKSDLLFSTLIDGWKTGKEDVDRLIEAINKTGDGFNFSRDYLMRLALVLTDADANLKITSLNGKAVENIRNSWNCIKLSLESLVETLCDVGVCGANLTSYNATMPLVYYLYKGGRIENGDDKKQVRKFLSVSMAKGLFGVASNAALDSTRKALQKIDCKNVRFSLSLFSDVSLTGGRRFSVLESDIDYWLDNFEKGTNTYILLSLLYPYLKLSQVVFHQDHCHPWVSFEDRNIKALGLAPEVVAKWKKKRDLLPNLQLLEGGENKEKHKKPLAEWIADGNDFEYHPEGVSLEFKDFDVFFDMRRSMIKEQLMVLFDVDQ